MRDTPAPKPRTTTGPVGDADAARAATAFLSKATCFERLMATLHAGEEPDV